MSLLCRCPQYGSFPTNTEEVAHALDECSNTEVPKMGGTALPRGVPMNVRGAQLGPGTAPMEGRRATQLCSWPLPLAPAADSTPGALAPSQDSAPVPSCGPNLGPLTHVHIPPSQPQLGGGGRRGTDRNGGAQVKSLGTIALTAS